MIDLKFDDKGLIPAVVQDIKSGSVVMVAYMDKEALKRTQETGLTWFYSRSRNKYWQKGETSGNIQRVKEIRYDCDLDCLLVLINQKGVGCHTGQKSCFHNILDPNETQPSHLPRSTQSKISVNSNIFNELFNVIENRKKNLPENSYTAKLFKEGLDKIISKVEEESDEVIEAAREKSKKDLTWEAADLIYHLFVLLADKDITFEDLNSELVCRRK